MISVTDKSLAFSALLNSRTSQILPQKCVQTPSKSTEPKTNAGFRDLICDYTRMGMFDIKYNSYTVTKHKSLNCGKIKNLFINTNICKRVIKQHNTAETNPTLYLINPKWSKLFK